ncbi:MAG: adenosylcobinamide-phosphate synthase CbiB [Chloroflexota bacterium]|nr:adenosylcobinamide-phosphate synthase CbiB [Chloroflexota bacterium]
MSQLSLYIADIPLEAGVLILAVMLDLLGRELPGRIHPTVWMGYTVRVAQRVAPRTRAAGLVAGTLIAVFIPAFWAACAWVASWGLAELHWAAYLIGGAALLKTTFAVRMLHRVAAQTESLALQGDLPGLRHNMRSLVSRDVSEITVGQAIAATVESVSENTTDSFVGVWLAFALFGLPGAFAYRAINTLDSMIGYRGEYEFLGKAAARLDDLVNLAPARVTALMLGLGSLMLPGQRAGEAFRVMWRDHARTASPNAGWTMAGMAGALGVELAKEGHYRLGDATRPLEPKDITRSVQSMYFIAGLGIAITLALLLLKERMFG